MVETLLECSDITKSFGGVPILKGVTLRLEPGTVTASTLLFCHAST